MLRKKGKNPKEKVQIFKGDYNIEIFDACADYYDHILGEQLSVWDKDIEYFAQYKVAKTYSLLNDRSNKKRVQTILDYGCGIGRSIPWIKHYFPDAAISGFDVSLKSLHIAASQYPYSKFHLISEDPNLMGNVVNEYKGSFDLIFLAGIFHHISLELRPLITSLIHSLMSDKSHLVVFEQNPFNPVTRYLVKQCPFDKGVSLLRVSEMKRHLLTQGLSVISFGYTLFFPGFLKLMRPLEPFMRSIPLGGQYYVYAFKK